jgi:hypothetical protein
MQAKCRFIHERDLYAELETRQTVLAFASNEAAEMNGLAILSTPPESPPAGVEICLVTDSCRSAREKFID